MINKWRISEYGRPGRSTCMRLKSSLPYSTGPRKYRNEHYSISDVLDSRRKSKLCWILCHSETWPYRRPSPKDRRRIWWSRWWWWYQLRIAKNSLFRSPTYQDWLMCRHWPKYDSCSPSRWRKSDRRVRSRWPTSSGCCERIRKLLSSCVRLHLYLWWRRSKLVPTCCSENQIYISLRRLQVFGTAAAWGGRSLSTSGPRLRNQSCCQKPPIFR